MWRLRPQARRVRAERNEVVCGAESIDGNTDGKLQLPDDRDISLASYHWLPGCSTLSGQSLAGSPIRL